MGAWDGELDEWYECPPNKDDSGDKGGDDNEGDEPKGNRSQVIVSSTSKAKEGTGIHHRGSTHTNTTPNRCSIECVEVVIPMYLAPK